MLCVETIGKIRRRRLVQGESISAIERDLQLSRNTVKRALRFEGEAFEYRRLRQPRPRLGPYLETLEGWLEAEEQLPARERRTAQRLYEALCLEGYTGAVDAVRRQVRQVEQRRHPSATAFILVRSKPQNREPIYLPLTRQTGLRLKPSNEDPENQRNRRNRSRNDQIGRASCRERVYSSV